MRKQNTILAIMLIISLLLSCVNSYQVGESTHMVYASQISYEENDSPESNIEQAVLTEQQVEQSTEQNTEQTIEQNIEQSEEVLIIQDVSNTTEKVNISVDENETENISELLKKSKVTEKTFEGNGYNVTFKIDSAWGDAYNATITIKKHRWC